MKAPYKQFYKRLAAMLGVLCVLAAPFAPTIVFAQEGGDPAPQCAVSGFGPTPCPVDLGAGTTKCYVRDPSQTDATAASAWQETGDQPCTDKAFTAPAAIDCSKDATYCDQAVQCASGNGASTAADPQKNCDLVAKYINPLIKALAAIIGIAVTASIIYAGIQYGTSADDPQKVTAAKQRILVSVLTLLGFFLFFAFLNWIIPGGVI